MTPAQFATWMVFVAVTGAVLAWTHERYQIDQRAEREQARARARFLKRLEDMANEEDTWNQ